ncbi:MAG TPA: hypothetical protein VFW87_22305, partial [Pirellulales bacterium]|nr:hypothetical protein [Pirellulales bacterium]
MQCVATRGDDTTSAHAIQVGRAKGRLAVAENIGGPWQVVEAPEALPKHAWLRSAPLSASRLDLPGMALHIAPNSRLEIDAHERLIRLADGRLAWEAAASAEAASTERQSYSVEAAARLVQIEPGSTAE